ncbi:MAG: cyclase family protein [Bacteroidota bacterium]
MKLIDLSLPVSSQLPGVSISPAKSMEKDGWNATTLQLYSHAGTHVDAPIHFAASDQSIEQMPLDAFYAECWVVDCQVKEKEELTLSHVEEIKDEVQEKDGLIFRTGWASRLGHESYRNSLPAISEELALWMVDKKIKLVGVEPPSIADVNDLAAVTRIHLILLGAGITIVEGLTNLELLPQPKVKILALPLKIVGGDGCPVRAVALIE